MEWSNQILVWLVRLGAPALLICVPIYFLTGRYKIFALRPLQRCYDGIELHEIPQAGDVVVTYHTYRGFLLWAIQNDHQFAAHPEDAQKLLRRLLKFNLTWGLLSYGIMFIPILAIANYYAQLRAIRQQLQAQS